MLYNRIFALEFGRPLLRANAFPFKEGNVLQGKDQALLIDDARTRIRFKASKSGKKALNKYEIIIDNMAQDKLDWLSSYRGEEVYVRLQAGYSEDEGLKTICLGTVQTLKTTKEGNTRTTKVTIKDGYTNVKEARSSLSFRAGTSHATIFNALRTDLGLPQGVVVSPSTSSPAPWSYSGPTYNGVGLLAKELGYRFHVTDQTLNFLPEDHVNLTLVRLYTPQTGVVGDVTALDNSSGNLQGNKKEQKVGIKFKVLLNGALRTDTLVQIESRDFNGTYKLTKVSHEGDSRGDSWYTNCEAVEARFDITQFAVNYSDFTVR